MGIILKRENTHFQIKKLLIIFTILVTLILVSLFRGSSKVESIIGIDKCSPLDFVFVGIFFFMCLLMCFITARILKKESDIKSKLGYEFVPSDPEWTWPNVFKMMAVGCFGGLISGTLGLGGGVIFNPLLLELNVNPIVASSTGMYMVMFSTLSSWILFVISGTLNIAYGLWLSLFVIIGTVYGLKSINKYVKESGRQSILVIMLSIVLGISAVVVPIFGVI